MTLREAIDTTLSLFQKEPNAEIHDIREGLLAEGIDAELAAKLVYFVPMALCRLVFGAAGVQFAPSYITIDEAGKETGEASLLEDPVYEEASSCCVKLLAPGAQAETYRALAARSADYKAIMELHLKQGGPLNSLSLPPPRLNLPPGKMDTSASPRKQPGQEAPEGASASPQLSGEAKEYMDTVKAHFDRPFVKQCFYEVTLLEWNSPEQGAVSFWAIQFRDQANGALIWQDSEENWRIGKWIRFAGREIPLPVDLRYFQGCPSAPSFQKAVSFLEAGQTQPTTDRPWYTRLWKRPQ